MAIAGDQSFLKHINRMALVRLVRSRPGLSRADLAEITGLTKSTVSQLIQELIDEGWLTEDDALITGSIGRRPTPLRLNTDRIALIGADLNVGKVTIIATNLRGEVIGSTHRELETNEFPVVIADLADGIAELVRTMLSQRRTVLGAGVGVPGPVHACSGVLHYSPNFGWRDVPFRSELVAALSEQGFANLPVFVQRRAAAAAVGEVEFADGEVAEPLLYVHLGLSVGAGVFVGDRLLSGHGGFAGDVGQQQLVSEGARKTADELIGLRAMSTSLGISPFEFQSRVAQGDASVQDALADGGHYLGVLIHNLWSTFDPAQVVLGGICSGFGGRYIESALKSLTERAQEGVLRPPKVSVARFGEKAVAIGATALVLHQMVRPM